MLSRSRVLQSTTGKRRRRRRLKVRLLLGGSIITLLCGGFIFLLHSSSIRIEKVYPVGNNLLSDEDVREVAREALLGNYFYLIPKNNIFLYPRDRIEHGLLTQFKEIKNMEVSFKDFKSITITLSERIPRALWCAQKESSECYFVDESGFIFRKVDRYNENLVTYVVPLEGEPIGQTLLTAEQFMATDSFLQKLKEQEITIIAVTFKEGGVREGEMSVGGTIIWNADQDLTVALENLKTLIDSPQFKSKDSDGNLVVEYIDIQNNNKIFYKARGK